MTTTLSGIAEELERLELDLIARVIGAYHTTRLSDVPANIHIRSKAHVREAFERYAAALIRTAEDREKVLREADAEWVQLAIRDNKRIVELEGIVRMLANFDARNSIVHLRDIARQALGGTNAK